MWCMLMPSPNKTHAQMIANFNFEGLSANGGR